MNSGLDSDLDGDLVDDGEPDLVFFFSVPRDGDVVVVATDVATVVDAENAWDVGAWVVGAWVVDAWVVDAWAVDAWAVDAWLVDAWLVDAWLVDAWLVDAWLVDAWLVDAWLDHLDSVDLENDYDSIVASV
jgi:hypothetical protein